MWGEDGVKSPGPVAGLSGLLLVVGIALGMITMHSTPAMGMSHGVGAGVSSSTFAAEADSAARSMMDSAVTPVVAVGATTILGDRGPEAPPQDHMLQPCLSDSTRSLHASVVSPAAIGKLDRAGRAVTVTSTRASQPLSHPPDLHELCISRT